MTDAAPTVLVTGATGAIAKHCLRALLARGYHVRGTVRRLAREKEVRRAAGVADGDPRLSLVVVDLDHDAGWSAALAGCSAVLHIASPFPLEQPRDRAELVRPAREGTVRVIEQAIRAGCRRVVVTSSIVAICYPRDRQTGLFTEADWTDDSRSDLTPYTISKTAAERAAWDLARRQAGRIEIVAVNPGLVLGPALDPDLSTSHALVRLIATGKYPALPRVGYAIADSRDVALAHMRALEVPAAAGERFLVANGYLTLREIGRLIVAELPDLARKVPTMEVPDSMLRMLALADRALAGVVPDLGVRREVSNARACEVLGMTFETPEEAVRAAARSLRAMRLI